MKIHVTQTFTITTEHEVDLANKPQYTIDTFLGVAIENQTHAACDALRGIQSDRFRVVSAGGTQGWKIEIK